MFGGFSCSRNSLILLNILYIIVSFILIGVAAYFRLAAFVVSFSLVASVIVCGVFLFFISLVGLIGAVKHHQVLLFFYMIILFLLFLVQFSFGCALLAVNQDQEVSLVKQGWRAADNQLKTTIQYKLECCGFEDPNKNVTDPDGHPSCDGLDCCQGSPASCCHGEAADEENEQDKCPCTTCLEKVKPRIHGAFTVTGAVGLVFSFTEFFGVGLALRYRNQKNPKANPDAFL